MHSRAELENQHFKKNKTNPKRKQNIYRQINDENVVVINKYNFKNKEAKNISIMTINDGKLRSRIDAKRMIWDEKSKSWKISYYDKRMFIGNNNFSFSEYAKDTLIDLNFSAMDLTKESVKPEEMNFFEDISSIGAFYRFNIAYPKTDHWNKPRKYNNVRSLFYKSVDEKTLNLICPRNHYDYTGEGTFYLDKDLVDTLFMFAERWCVAHDIKDVFWVASCIIQFSCI